MAEQPTREGPKGENGPSAPEGNPPLSPEQQIEALRSSMEVYMRPIMGVLFRGIFSSMPGAPAILVIKTIAKIAGELVAHGITSGEMGAIYNARREFAEEFKKGMASVEIAMPKTPVGGKPS